MTTKSAPSQAPNDRNQFGGAYYHGDLRKGAYLRRRADYQMQAQPSSTPGTQSGVRNKRTSRR